MTGEVSYGSVPPYSVVVSGSLPAADGSHSLYCAVIVKQVDEKTRSKTSVNESVSYTHLDVYKRQGRMQFDLFHVFTVDQHTLAVLRNLASFSSGEADPRFAITHLVWPSLRKPELLLLAGLFHDIGKGRGGDHSELGAVDARVFCEAHALSEADIALVEWLVRKHLLMSITAQKQDITDPDVIHRFAEIVADRQRLDLSLIHI